MYVFIGNFTKKVDYNTVRVNTANMKILLFILAALIIYFLVYASGFMDNNKED